MTLVAAQLISVLTAPAFFYAGVRWGQHTAKRHITVTGEIRLDARKLAAVVHRHRDTRRRRAE